MSLCVYMETFSTFLNCIFVVFAFLKLTCNLEQLKVTFYTCPLSRPFLPFVLLLIPYTVFPEENSVLFVTTWNKMVTRSQIQGIEAVVPGM